MGSHVNLGPGQSFPGELKTESTLSDPMNEREELLLELDERCGSGCAGLDDIIGGGLPKGHFYLLEGEPGTGKTTLA
jgi:predicted ATP-dependent serine protease